MAMRPIVVFGGTGFLGRRIVERLLARNSPVRVAVRHPERASSPDNASGLFEAVRVDVRDRASVNTAVAGAVGVTNAVSLYAEHGGATFRNIHVEGAHNVAAAAKQQGIERMLHISGIGASLSSSCRYIRCRAEGERMARASYRDAIIFRPSAMFAHDDALLNTLFMLARRMPVIPLFGRGQTRLQPVFADDVADAAARVLTGAQTDAHVYELGGPQVYSYRALVQLVVRQTGHRRLLLPVPFVAWEALATAAQLLPAPPLMPSQVALMKRDNCVSPGMPTLHDLGITPTGIEAILRTHFQ